MKMLKKLAALILAATMVLVLFTACGGDTPSTPEAQAEAQMMSTINAKRPEGKKLENNSERRAVASTNIDLAASGKLAGYSSDVWFKMDTDEIKDGKFAFTFVAKYDYQNTKLDSMIQKITGGNGSNVVLNNVTNWTDVGVVVKTVNGQTYMAVSVAVDVHPN